VKVLEFTLSHAALESLMSQKAITRLLKLQDLGHERDQYIITALIRQEMLDTIIEKSSDRPRWIRWP
jgi:hypothetical protein